MNISAHNVLIECTDNDHPLISVITICRNAEAIIKATMLSVLSQTYQAVEYIIVDGLSSDRTLDIIHKTSNLFPQCNIRIVSEVDRGIADAMNKGIVLSSGKVITHLHAGDRYIDNLVIERVIQSYCQEHWSWAVAGSVVVDKHGKILHNFKAHSDFKILLKKNCIPHQSTFLDKNIFERYGLFDLKYKQAMDYEYWLRIAFKGGERFTVLPFNTTYFLEGGRSANIFELLQYLSILRRSMRKYGCKTNLFDDLIFLFRVLAFSIVYQLKRKLYLL